MMMLNFPIVVQSLYYISIHVLPEPSTTCTIMMTEVCLYHVRMMAYVLYVMHFQLVSRGSRAAGLISDSLTHSRSS